jgi:toxin YoeB
MAKKIIWTLKAQQERKEILHYWRIRNQSNSYSKKLNELFKQSILLVSTHPNIGRPTDIEDVRVKLVRDKKRFRKIKLTFSHEQFNSNLYRWCCPW